MYRIPLVIQKGLLFILTVLLLTFILAGTLHAQSPRAAEKLYHPEANAAKDIREAVAEAARTHKNVFIQLGGNWCTWCLAFHRFVKEDTALSRVLQENYVIYHLNYSPENKNVALLEKYQYPQRFGFPCFLILNQKGALLHTQNSAYLEKGKGYDSQKVLTFFQNWTVAALSRSTYQQQLGE